MLSMLQQIQWESPETVALRASLPLEDALFLSALDPALKQDCVLHPDFVTPHRAKFDLGSSFFKARARIVHGEELDPSSTWQLMLGRTVCASFRHGDMELLSRLCGFSADSFLPFMKLLDRDDFLPGGRSDTLPLTAHLIAAGSKGASENLHIKFDGYHASNLVAEDDTDRIVDMRCATVSVSDQHDVMPATDGAAGCAIIPLNLLGLVSHLLIRVEDASGQTVRGASASLIVQRRSRVPPVEQHWTDDGALVMKFVKGGGVVEQWQDVGLNFTLLDNAHVHIQFERGVNITGLTACVQSVFFNVVRTQGGRMVSMLL
jgi:hypothetical protein